MKIYPYISFEDFQTQYQSSFVWYQNRLAFISDIQGLSDFTLDFFDQKDSIKPGQLSHRLIEVKKPLPRWVPIRNSYYYITYRAPRAHVNGITENCLRIYPDVASGHLKQEIIVRFLGYPPKTRFIGPVSWADFKTNETTLISPQLLYAQGTIWRGDNQVYPYKPLFEPYLATIIPDLPRTTTNETN